MALNIVIPLLFLLAASEAKSLSSPSSEGQANSTPDIQISSQNIAVLENLIRTKWENNQKIAALANFIQLFLNSPSEGTNVITIVGWQNVLNPNGNVQEVKAIELVIPIRKQKTEPVPSLIRALEENNINTTLEQINILKAVAQPIQDQLESVGASVTISLENKQGSKRPIALVVNPNGVIINNDLIVLNQTSVASGDEITRIIRNLPQNLGPPTVLKYGTNGHLIPSQSQIQPSTLVNVLDSSEDIPKNVLLNAPKIFAEVVVQTPKNAVSRQLASKLNQALPEYKWRVLVNAENVAVNKDVVIRLKVDDLDGAGLNLLDEYLAYGSSRNNRVPN